MDATSGGKTVTITPYENSGHTSGSSTLTGTYSISGNGSATKTVTVTFKNYDYDGDPYATKNVAFDVTVPAWTSYTVSYNANDGSGTPSSQTKWKDQTLILSSTKPTRTGYKFLGWSKTSTATTATYTSGGSYSGTDTSSPTLYAVWSKRSQSNSYLYNNGKCYTGEYIEGQSLGFGTGTIYSKKFIEKSLTFGNYAMSNTEFIALTLCEGEP